MVLRHYLPARRCLTAAEDSRVIPFAACSDALIVYLLQKLFNALAIESRHSASAAGSTVSAILERLFNRIKQMPGLATRYDQRADNYLAALKLAATSANESAS